MPAADFIYKVVPLFLTLLLIVVDRWKRNSDARSAEKKANLILTEANERRVEEIRSQYQSQVTYLQEQLDECLDDSRHERPDRKKR